MQFPSPRQTAPRCPRTLAVSLVLWALIAPRLSLAALGPARYECQGYLVLRLVGSPEACGRQHGQLAGDLVRRVVHEVITTGEADTPEQRERLLAGARTMADYLPEAYRQELRALAVAARVDYDELVALQLFGDVWRGTQCSSYAVYGPATAGGECLVGRNLDFWDHGVSRYAGVILHYVPDHGYPFVTVSWAGIINGWTAMNAKGVVCANNTAYGGEESLEGLSTCFMVRQVAQYATAVDEGVAIVQRTPRACGTNLLIAGGNPPRAAIVEYDHRAVAVRWARRGAVWATNHFRRLGRDTEMTEAEGWCSRYHTLTGLIAERYGRLDRQMNLAAAPGVPLRGLNLHSALLFPRDLTLKLSMGRTPAADYPYRGLRLTPQGLVAAP